VPFTFRFFFSFFHSPFCNLKGACSPLGSFPLHLCQLSLSGISYHLGMSVPRARSIYPIYGHNLQLIVPEQTAAPTQTPTASRSPFCHSEGAQRRLSAGQGHEHPPFPCLSPIFPMAFAGLQQAFLAPHTHSKHSNPYLENFIV